MAKRAKFPKISCYPASASHRQQLPLMAQSKMSLWQASLCNIQVSSLPCQPSLSQPACPCPVCCCCCPLTFLSVFDLMWLLQPVCLSEFLYAGWLHFQDYLASLFHWFFKPNIKADDYGAICCLFEWITPTFLVELQDGLHGMTGLNSCHASSASDTFA